MWLKVLPRFHIANSFNTAFPSFPNAPIRSVLSLLFWHDFLDSFLCVLWKLVTDVHLLLFHLKTSLVTKPSWQFLFSSIETDPLQVLYTIISLRAFPTVSASILRCWFNFTAFAGSFVYSLLEDSWSYMSPILAPSSAKRTATQILVIAKLNGRKVFFLSGFACDIIRPSKELLVQS